MAISKKLRFEVFKRDGFCCQYCGKTPPDVTLEADHINPKSMSGKDEINNLITACFDCNRGKGSIPLEKAPSSLVENFEVLKEKELQIKEYNKLIAKIERRLKTEADKIDEIYNSYFPDWHLTEKFRVVSLKKFLKMLPFQVVADSMHRACNKILRLYFCKDRNNDAIKYFCGICWNKIKGTENDAE